MIRILHDKNSILVLSKAKLNTLMAAHYIDYSSILEYKNT